MVLLFGTKTATNHSEVSFFSGETCPAAKSTNHPCHNFRSEMCSDSLKERQIPSVFFIPNLAPLMAADSDTILGVFGGSASTGGPGPSLGLQFQGLIVSRYKVTTGVGGRNGKKHSGNSV